MCLSLDQLNDFDYYNFKSIFKTYIIKLVSVMPVTLIFFRTVLAILVALPFPTNFRISLSVSTRKSCWSFDWNCFKSIDQCEEM